jgi:hypothetical protein
MNCSNVRRARAGFNHLGFDDKFQILFLPVAGELALSPCDPAEKKRQ